MGFFHGRQEQVPTFQIPFVQSDLYGGKHPARRCYVIGRLQDVEAVETVKASISMMCFISSVIARSPPTIPARTVHRL